jgi:hypothetical protein
MTQWWLNCRRPDRLIPIDTVAGRIALIEKSELGEELHCVSSPKQLIPR